MRPTDWSPVNLSSDPIPGDPTVVASGGNDYIEVATAISNAERRLRSLDAGSLVVSEAVDALQETAVEVADNISRAEKRYREVGNALVTYAPALEAAQTESADALLTARSAMDDSEASSANRRHYLRLAGEASDPDQALTYTNLADNYESDAGYADSRQSGAVTRVHDAITARDRAADAAVSSIKNITGSDDLNDGWWDDWGKDILSVITDVAGWVSAIAGVLALLVSWIPVVGQVLAAALLVVAGIAALVNMIGNIVLASTGDRTWLEAGLSIAGAVLSLVGMGAAVKVVAKVLSKQSVTMKLGQQITARQALRLKPSDWKQWAVDMRTPVPKPASGDEIYRVYGDKSGPSGGSWSPANPENLINARTRLGVPDGNSMENLATATLKDPDAVLLSRHALPFDGKLGGAPEYIILKEAQRSGIAVTSDVPFVIP